jgi:predicted TIM-barrel fold metal-dependent hydrolase
MTKKPHSSRFLGTALLLVLSVSVARAELPLFDAHLHYSGEDAEAFTPAEIVAILERHGVTRALVSGTPNATTEALHREAPGQIVPFLSVYRDARDKRDWMHDQHVPGRVEADLESGIYRGIGELHIFAKDRASPVLRRIVEIAAERGLLLQVHGDAQVLDTIFAIASEVTVLWAHLGTRPEPELVRTMLERYPDRLYVDTSVRDGRIMPDQAILPAWRDLFKDHSDRFLIGVDTFSVNRWRRFGQVAAHIRAWLGELPTEVAQKLAHGNAERLFGLPGG